MTYVRERLGRGAFGPPSGPKGPNRPRQQGRASVALPILTRYYSNTLDPRAFRPSSLSRMGHRVGERITLPMAVKETIWRTIAVAAVEC